MNRYHYSSPFRLAPCCSRWQHCLSSTMAQVHLFLGIRYLMFKSPLWPPVVILWINAGYYWTKFHCCHDSFLSHVLNAKCDSSPNIVLFSFSNCPCGYSWILFPLLNINSRIRSGYHLFLLWWINSMNCPDYNNKYNKNNLIWRWCDGAEPHDFGGYANKIWA